MRYFIYISLVLFICCQSADKVKKPDHLLSEEKMVNILSDLAILKSANDVNSERLSKFIEDPFGHITKKYQVDSLTLEKNIEYYNFQFNKNLSIYKKVQEKIANRKSKLDSIEKVMDSLKKQEIKEDNNKKKLRSND